MKPQNNSIRTVLWREVWIHWPRLLITLLWSAAIAFATSLYALVSGPLLSALSNPEKHGSFPILGEWFGGRSASPQSLLWVLVAAAAVRSIATYGSSVSGSRLQQAVVRGLRKQLVDRLLHGAPLAWQRWRAGDLAARFHAEIHGIRGFLQVGLVGVGRHAVVATTLAIIALRMDTRLATYGLIGLPVLALTGRALGGRIRRRQLHLYRAEAAATSAISELASGLAVLRAFGAEASAATRFAALNAASEREAVAAERTHGLGPASLEVIAVSAVVLAVWLSGGLHGGAAASPTRLSALAALLFMYRPLVALVQSMFSIAGGLAALDRLQEWMQTPLIANAEQQPRLSHPTLHTQGLCFQYDDRPLLRDVHLQLSPGELVAIHGASGAGKSTLLSCLSGVLEPRAGDCTLRQDTRKSNALRAHVGWMPQAPVLFADSVLNNIALGDPAPSLTKATQAARAARADSFIEALPHGYATRLEEGGRNLSVGQRQRLCLARALYRDAPILLLDEPTAALDAELEEALLAHWLDLRASGRALLVVTRSPGILARATRVLELVDGRLQTTAPRGSSVAPSRLVGVPS